MPAENPLQWDIQQNGECLVIRLTGSLTRDTLLPLWMQRACFLAPQANQALCWDLQSLTRIDSAGFTLLVELLNRYKKQHPLSLINTPESVIKLAELFDLSEWFSSFLSHENI